MDNHIFMNEKKGHSRWSTVRRAASGTKAFTQNESPMLGQSHTSLFRGTRTGSGSNRNSILSGQASRLFQGYENGKTNMKLLSERRGQRSCMTRAASELERQDLFLADFRSRLDRRDATMKMIAERIEAKKKEQLGF